MRSLIACTHTRTSTRNGTLIHRGKWGEVCARVRVHEFKSLCSWFRRRKRGKGTAREHINHLRSTREGGFPPLSEYNDIK